MEGIPPWLLPWTLAALMIWPLVLVERWIHKHIQGLGLLLTNNPKAAVLIYYLVLFPGVALHEASQWVLAQLLRVKVKKFRVWPEQQRGGVIQLGLVEIQSGTDAIRATLIGMIPLITGVAAIAWIASAYFDTGVLLTSLATGDLPEIFRGFGVFMSAPDFWLWMYLVFTIANAMLPEAHDRINWWLLVGVFAGLLIFLWVLDLNVLIRALLEGPLARIGGWLSLALSLALGIDLLMMALIAFSEWLFSRLLDREIEYK
ncbi:MAG: hypothetical protein Kow00124_12950 [Anaerolineae bacterium]